MGQVSRLAVAPVKGLALTHPTEVFVGPTGVPENRRFYLVGPDGRHRSGLAFGPLATIVPDYDPVSERLGMRFPDGRRYEGDACDLDEAIEVPWGTDQLQGRVLRGPWAEVLSAFVGMELRLVRAEPDRHPQSRPVSIISQASVDELERASDLPGPLDDRRFRMLVTLDGVTAREEDTWVGRRVAIGEAVVEVAMAVPRCATTTRDPETGLRDWDALRAVKELRGLSIEQTVDFGVYATVVQPGQVAIGDEVRPI
jgi:uncharacterized protein YcbX